MYLSPHLRSSIAQFRAGILPIEIELGRYKNKRPEERICPVCTSGEIEDERHLLFRCEHYNALRTTMLHNIDIDINDPAISIRTLMDNYTKIIAIFINSAIQKRKNTIYIHQ